MKCKITIRIIKQTLEAVAKLQFSTANIPQGSVLEAYRRTKLRSCCETVMRFAIGSLKIFFAGFAAVIILSIFCLFYYKSSLYTRNTSGVTDIVAEPYSTYRYATEGFGYGKMNNEGFQNLYDYNGQNINVLIMGSSHMEGFQVPQHLTVSARLSEFVDSQTVVYNIAKGGTSFDRACKNFEKALDYYKPSNFAVIETAAVNFPVMTLKRILENNVQSNFDGFKFMGFDITKIRNIIRSSSLKHLYYIRLAAKEINIFTSREFGNKEMPQETISDEYIHELNNVLEQIAQTSKKYSVQPIIFYHPRLVLNKDASAVPQTNTEYLAIFADLCRKQGILFLDMTDIFVKNYEENDILPHGFANSRVGAGHLNKHGHAMTAQTLAHVIRAEGG
jgi:hypothetical protein